MPRYFYLKDGVPTETKDLVARAEMIHSQIAYDVVDGSTISTVFIGIATSDDHLFWETFVSREEGDGIYKYSSKAEALNGHAKHVREARRRAREKRFARAAVPQPTDEIRMARIISVSPSLRWARQGIVNVIKQRSQGLGKTKAPIFEGVDEDEKGYFTAKSIRAMNLDFAPRKRRD